MLKEVVVGVAKETVDRPNVSDVVVGIIVIIVGFIGAVGAFGAVAADLEVPTAGDVGVEL